MNYSTIKRIGLTAIALACAYTMNAEAALSDNASALNTSISQAMSNNGVPVSQVKIQIGQDEVQLCGFVTSDQSTAAEKAAESVVKNGDVVNDLISTDSILTKFRANDKADVKNISAAVASKIATIGTNAANQSTISAQTYRGIVQLCGFVNDSDIKDKAYDAVKDITGVTKVHNNIIVQ